MDNPVQPEILDRIVSRVFTIDSVTYGPNGHRNVIAQYSGRILCEDTTVAYDELSEGLRPYGLMPLFRKQADQQTVVLIPAISRPHPSNPWINLILFILTVISVFLTGVLYTLETPLPADPMQAALMLLSNLWRGWSFAVPMLAILTAHEFGHYLAGRYHKTQVTLPYFIPLPFSQFGTMGAFINMKEPPKNRRILLDIGIAGPLAGLAVAIPVLLIGLAISKLDALPSFVSRTTVFQLEGNSLLYLFAKYLVFGKWLPSPVSYAGLAPFVYWLRFFFTGHPLPLGGIDVQLSPVAWAGWAGILVTSLNLIPVGQLDGGHMLYVLIGSKRARQILPIILTGLVALGFVWPGWWLWAFLIFLLGRVYAEPLDQITPLDSKRKALAILALVIFVLVFTPVPLSIIGA